MTVELGKFQKRAVEDLVDFREKWRYLLKESSYMNEEEGRWFSRSGMEEAMSHLKELSREEQFRILEEAKEKNWRDEQARMDHAVDQGLKKGIEQGIERGLKQGLKQGMERGLEQGIEKGMKRGLTKGVSKGRKEMVIRMLKNGLDADLISKISGLSKQEINTLKENL